ncbi:alpha/beta hydrolase-fold protein [Lonepinella koalarum]|uniref:carboxylesterase family protein n=1 Tax=Lonepinella koalarum TaxID=53417 RepID=UPI003F6E087B
MKKILTLSLISLLMAACSVAQTPATNSNDAKPARTGNGVGGPQLGAIMPSVNAYGGVDKSYDTTLPALSAKIAPRFQTLKFTDKTTGKTLEYSLYTPQNIEPNKQYPLVMFIGDATTAGRGTDSPLKQGYGGIIWATDESQAKNPAFVLVPSFTGVAVDDAWQHTDEVDLVKPLIDEVVKHHAIDKNRLYATGQSMGGMISLHLNSLYPDLFAASMFVSCGWDINVLAPLKQAKFLYISNDSRGGQKADTMGQIEDMLSQANIAYGSAEFSAKLPQAEQNQQVSDLLAQGHKANFIRFSKGTVLPSNLATGQKASEHMYSFDYAYLLDPAREWLFKQRKNAQ